MGDVLVEGGATRRPSEHCKGTKPTIAHVGPCGELVTYPSVDPAFAHHHKSDEGVKETRCWAQSGQVNCPYLGFQLVHKQMYVYV